jgi:uncharacterized protein (TIGR00297 family)
VIIISLFTGLVLGGVIAFLAHRAGALSGSGALAAALSGGLIFGLGGLPWAALLLTFFISSSALSRLFSGRKKALSEKFSKGARRDWGQVLANGGLGALLALAHAVFPGQEWIFYGYLGALAAVNADTWATELGVLSRRPPRLITTGRLVERGASGGVTPLGYLSVGLGGLLVGLAAVVFNPGAPAAKLLAGALLAGLAGSSFDSFLGATVQAIYCCPACKKETERHPRHTCGVETVRLRGWPWLDNDLVNFACSLAGAGAAVLAWALL